MHVKSFYTYKGIYACNYTSTIVPTLDEARGTMVLLSSDYATKGISLSPIRDGTSNINGSYKDPEQLCQDVAKRLGWIESRPVSDVDTFCCACGSSSYWFLEDGSSGDSVAAALFHGFDSPRDYVKYTKWRMSEMVRGNFLSEGRGWGLWR
jgi:hypothetical protein